MGASKLVVVALGLAAGVGGKREPVPKTEAETASGAAVTLPDSFHGQVALLIVGFTRASADAVRDWETSLSTRHRADPGFAIERIAVLDSVPRILRAIVRVAARGQEAPSARDRFVLLFHAGDAWRTWAGFDPRAADDAYLIVVDRQGRACWRGHSAQSRSTARDGGPGTAAGLEEALRATLHAP